MIGFAKHRLTQVAPLALLLCTLASVVLFVPERGLFLGKDHHNLHFPLTYAESMTYDHLLDAINMWPRHYFVSARSVHINADGELAPAALYNRFPIGGRLLLHLATSPFDDPWKKVRVARTLMIGFFFGAATLACLALTALRIDRWAAVAATLLAFGSSYHFAYHDMVATQGVVDLFGVMLVFHGMATFAVGRPLGQLLAKTCVALLLGWHVYGLLLPFVVLGIAVGVARRDWLGAFRHGTLGATAFAVGVCVLAFNLVGEFLALGGQTPWTELPTVRSAAMRIGIPPKHWGDLAASPVPTFAGWTLDALWEQFRRVGEAMLPNVLTSGFAMWFDNDGESLLRWTGVAATLSAVGFSSTARHRHGGVLASVALGGWCWALPMRDAVATHEFEALFFVGVPLVLYALALASICTAGFRLARLGVPLGPAVAALASLGFVCSAIAVARERHASVDFAHEATLQADIRTIRELAPEGATLHAPQWNVPIHWKRRHRVLLAGYPVLPSSRDADHVVAFAMPDERSLTPANQLVFLFRRADYEAAAADVVARYRTVTERHRPVVRSECCDVFSLGSWVLYHDRNCGLSPVASDSNPGFFLHVTPVDIRDLPAGRRPDGFGNHNFVPGRFQQRDDFCFTVVRLPPYDIAEIHTGQYQRTWLSDRTPKYQELWGGRFSPIESPQGEREGLPRAEEPSAGEREVPASRMEEPSADRGG